MMVPSATSLVPGPGARTPPDSGPAHGGGALATGAGAGPASAWRRLLRSRRGLAGVVVLALLGFCTLAAPALAPADPAALNPRIKLVAPLATSSAGRFHLFGTDQVGRDVFGRVLFSGRVSLGLALAAVCLGGTWGVAAGLLSAYHGGWLEVVLMRLADVQLAVPTVLLAIGIVATVGRSLTVLASVLALSTWIIFARTVRGTTLSLKESAFVEAARAAGASEQRILLRHILHNSWTPIIVIASQQMALMIVLESSLSFIGAGTPASSPSWGTMVADGRDYVLSRAWWLVSFPGLAISLAALAINFLGDGLRDALDPRLRL